MFRSEDWDLGHQALSAIRSGTKFDVRERLFPVLFILYRIDWRVGTKTYPVKCECSLKLLSKSLNNGTDSKCLFGRCG